MADSPESERVYDVVVVGTGLTESLLAGACARNGKRVLHLDHHAHYGSRSASFNLAQFDSWLRGLGPEGKDDAGLADGRGPFVDGAIRVTPVSDAPRDVSFTGAAEGLTETGAHPGMTAAALGELHRYSIDLTPQLLLCGGPMVDTLRSSGVASYLEFKPMQAPRPAPSPATPPMRTPRPPPSRAEHARSRTCTAVSTVSSAYRAQRARSSPRRHSASSRSASS